MDDLWIERNIAVWEPVQMYLFTIYSHEHTFLTPFALEYKLSSEVFLHSWKPDFIKDHLTVTPFNKVNC